MIAVRTDGNPAAGLGHVRRCLALTAALAPSFDVRFFLSGSEDVARLIRREGFRCDLVSPLFQDTLAAVHAAEAAALVIDSYEVTSRHYEAVRSRLGLLVILDDAGLYPLPAGLVVNPAPGAAEPPGENGTRYLLGPRFALLRREFADPVTREIGEQVGRLLLILGGTTRASLIAALARIARRTLPAAVLDLVVGPVGDDASRVAGALSGLDGVSVHAAPEGVRSLMLEADLAVTAGGVTVFELAATGTPAVGVELAPNQRPNLAGMAEAGALLVAGRVGDMSLDGAVARALGRLAPDVESRRAMSRRGRELVDGRGAERVAEAIRARLQERRPVVGRLA